VLTADQQTSRSAQLNQFKFRPTCHCLLFDVLSLVFDTVGVAVFIVYHFMLCCRPGTRTIYYFLTQNQIRIPPKIVYAHLTWENCDNIWIQIQTANSVTSIPTKPPGRHITILLWTLCQQWRTSYCSCLLRSLSVYIMVICVVFKLK